MAAEDRDAKEKKGLTRAPEQDRSKPQSRRALSGPLREGGGEPPCSGCGSVRADT